MIFFICYLILNNLKNYCILNIISLAPGEKLVLGNIVIVLVAVQKNAPFIFIFCNRTFEPPHDCPPLFCEVYETPEKS